MNINTENTTLSYPEIIKCQQAFRNYKLCLIDKTKSAVLSYSKSIKTPQQRLDKFRCAIDINNLRITCNNKITDIDPIVFAYFVLFKQETPQLKITIIFNGGATPNIPSFLTQLINHAVISPREQNSTVQPICGIEKLKVTYTSKKDDISVFPNNFIPLVFINKNYFEAYFLRKVDSFIKGSLQNGKNPDQPSPSREELNHRICSYQIGQGKRSRLIFVYASLAFLDGLESTLMLTAYLGLDEELLGKNSLDKKSKKISYKMHDPNNEDHHNYYKKLKPIFDDLLTRPLITHYVFALILKAELPNITTINKDLDKYAKFIENLWHFTLEVVVGLEELAKNIVQHSTTGCGVITARIHTKKEENNLFKTYADLLLAMEDGLKSVLNINVIDLGRNGVVDNLSQYTRSHAENASEKLKALLKQDLDVLNGEDFSVKNLVDPKENKKQTLHQQAKRAIAHFGLLVLSRLIIDTGGGIYVATNTKKCKETDRDQAWVNIIVPQSTPLHMQ